MKSSNNVKNVTCSNPNNEQKSTVDTVESTPLLNRKTPVAGSTCVFDPLIEKSKNKRNPEDSFHPEKISLSYKDAFNFNGGRISSATRNAASRAARVLGGKKRMLICIGENTRNKQGDARPTMNGVRGAVVLAMSARDSGSIVTFVADPCTGGVLQDMLAHIGAEESEAVTGIEINTFTSNQDANGLQPNAEAKAEATAILAKTQADAVVTIDLPDTFDKIKTNGTANTVWPDVDVNKPIYEVVRAAAARDISIVAVGTGSNRKVGFGPTPSTLSVQGNISNPMAMTIGAFLMKLRGKFDLFVSPQRFEKLSYSSYASKTHATPQDQQSSETQGVIRNSVNDFKNIYTDSNNTILKSVIQLVKEHEDVPTNLAIFDSSNGAFVAAKVLKEEFEKLGYLISLIIVVDHGNAPYGKYAGEKEEKLYRLVSAGLKVCETRGAELVGMACNTACIVPDAQQEIAIPVVDLIQVTAKAIAKDGGARPVLISTVATTQSDVYPDAVLKASGNTINLRSPEAHGLDSDHHSAYMIGAPEWVDKINQLGVALDEPQQASVIHEMIEKVVMKVPEDATSVWLTCTHYPVLQTRIEAALRSRGLHVKVVNPMTYQAQAIAEQIEKLEVSGKFKARSSILEANDVVVSSAKAEDIDFIKQAVSELYKETPTEILNWEVNPT